MQPKVYPMTKSPAVWTPAGKSSANGVSASSKSDWPACKNAPDRAGPGLFPPELIVQVKALACELPATHHVPLSRWSLGELTQYVCQSGLVAQLSSSTLWRWLHQDAIRPWQHRCWIFPRDPGFALKAGRILDLYQHQWEGQELHADEFVLSTDEKTSIQARCRRHETLPPQPGLTMKVEHEYERQGAWAYLAAWDVHRAKLFGRCEAKTGIAPFDRLIAQVMDQEPYRSARRVFWIMDNGSSHRGERSVQRLQSRYPNAKVVHGPVHASWLNQIEIYFSIIQRKVLTPNDFLNLEALAERLERFERHYEAIAKPFQWQFTRNDLNELLRDLPSSSQRTTALAA
jgi:DDE superfamily endonuclease